MMFGTVACYLSSDNRIGHGLSYIQIEWTITVHKSNGNVLKWYSINQMDQEHMILTIVLLCEMCLQINGSANVKSTRSQ